MDSPSLLSSKLLAFVTEKRFSEISVVLLFTNKLECKVQSLRPKIICIIFIQQNKGGTNIHTFTSNEVFTISIHINLICMRLGIWNSIYVYKNIMKKKKLMPLINDHQKVSEAILEMTSKGQGCVVYKKNGQLLGGGWIQ